MQEPSQLIGRHVLPVDGIALLGEEDFPREVQPAVAGQLFNVGQEVGVKAVHYALHRPVTVHHELLDLLAVHGRVQHAGLARQGLHGAVLLVHMDEELGDPVLVAAEVLHVLLLEVVRAGLESGVHQAEEAALLLALVDLDFLEGRVERSAQLRGEVGHPIDVAHQSLVREVDEEESQAEREDEGVGDVQADEEAEAGFGEGGFLLLALGRFDAGVVGLVVQSGHLRRLSPLLVRYVHGRAGAALDVHVHGRHHHYRHRQQQHHRQDWRPQQDAALRRL